MVDDTVYDYMGGVAAPATNRQPDPNKGPGIVEKAFDRLYKAGATVGRPMQELAQRYTENTQEAAREAANLAVESSRKSGQAMREGRPLDATGQAIWQTIGNIGIPFAPLTGAAKTAGDYATKFTGDPTFGAKVALAGEMVDPSHIGMLKKMAPAVLGIAAVPGTPLNIERVRSTVSQVAPQTAPAHQTTPLGLYSHAAEVASGLKQPGKPQDVYNWLSKQPGVRKEELVAAGIIDDAGNLHPEFASMSRVTPQELSERIKKGAPEVEETVLPFYAREIDPKYQIVGLEEARRMFPDKQFRGVDTKYVLIEKDMYGDPRFVDKAYHEHEFLNKYGFRSKYGPDVYPELTTPGGSNYREVILRIPSVDQQMFYYSDHPLLRYHQFKTLEDMRSYADDIVRKHDEHKAAYPAMYPKESSDPLVNWADELRNQKYRIAQVPDDSVKDPNLRNFSHYNEETNPLLHIRMQDVPSPQRGLTLRIEEIQSDWAQQARKKGFRPTEAQIEDSKKAVEELKARLAENDQNMIRTYGKDDAEYERLYRENIDIREQMAQHNQVLKKTNGLPKAPYVGDTKQWTELGVKRALLEAGRNTEYDSVQFIKGDINRNRYGAYYGDEDYGYHYDVNVPSALKNILKKLDPEAKITTAKSPINLENVRHLEDSIRSFKAEQKKAEAEQDLMTVYELEDELTILKQQLEVAMKPMEFWEVKMTPKLREALQQGLPRFAAGGAVDHDDIDRFMKERFGKKKTSDLPVDEMAKTSDALVSRALSAAKISS